ncbi:MAG: taurine ABC transporter substrate-binding protein [Candidatus Rokuibacteriota bacterium]|nr:MAG: taurine ABC transporter substrate-binding protein [Candidatus Rokubacteria bacterium]
MYLAKEKGFFKTQGVDVDIQVIEDTKLGMAALAANRIDMYGVTPNTLLLYVKPDARFVMVMVGDGSAGGDGIVARKEITSIAALKGKRVAFLEGSVAQFYLSYLLKKEGLSEKDVTPLNMTTGDAGAAFVAGRVDAAVVWEPWLSKGKSAPHGHLLIDSRQNPGIIVDTLAFRADVVQTRREDVRKVIRGVNQAVAFWKSNPKEANEIMAKGLGGWLKDPKDFEEALSGAKLYDVADNRQLMGSAQQPGPFYQTVREAIEFWRSSGKLVWPDVKPQDVIDPSLLE